MRVLRMLAVLLFAAAPTLCGCESVGGPPPSSRELSSAQFDDIPVPRGFVLDLSPGRSFSYAEGGAGVGAIRLGRLEYTGLGDSQETLAWYAAEMPRPMHGWSTGAPHGTRPDALLFRRDGEACLVTALLEGSQLRIVVERNTGGAVGRE
jgi:hypothetical protein